MSTKPLLINCNTLHIPLPSGIVQTIVTSPPYYLPRSYGVINTIWEGDKSCQHHWQYETHKPTPHGKDAITNSTLTGSKKSQQSTRLVDDVEHATCTKCNAWLGVLGLEPSLDMYINHTVMVAREWRRVLHDTGILFLNIGDTFINKQRQLVPHKVAIALQEDGWFVRCEIPWHKPTAMPDPTGDRPNISHETIYMLTKSSTYYYDPDAIRMPSGRMFRTSDTQTNIYDGIALDRDGHPLSITALPSRYGGNHFATFSPELITPFIKAGNSIAGKCPQCHTPWARVVTKTIVPTKKGTKTTIIDQRDLNGHHTNDQGSNRQRDGHKLGWVSKIVTLGWKPTCSCYQDYIHITLQALKLKNKDLPQDDQENIAHALTLFKQNLPPHLQPVPTITLDPFIGSGTTCEVARTLGHASIGLDLSLAYLQQEAIPRLELDKLHKLKTGKSLVKSKPARADYAHLPLFATGVV